MDAKTLSERIRKRWNGLRFNKDYHLGLGDVRLTIGMQDELLDEVAQLEAELERWRLLFADNMCAECMKYGLYCECADAD